jgi:hypothetical protein
MPFISIASRIESLAARPITGVSPAPAESSVIADSERCAKS